MIVLRDLEARDRDGFPDLLADTGMFTPAEIAVALELVDTALKGGEPADYLFRIASEDGGPMIGYACFGSTPLTEGTFDLYWIAVSPAFQGRGVGRRLLAAAETEARKRGGRLMVVETSSQEKYAPTRVFYLAGGYGLAARIPDFYRPGDDKLIFTRYL